MIYQDYNDRYRALAYPGRTDLDALRAYNEEQATITAEFSAALREEYLHENASDTTAESVWNLAWSHGHSAGYSEVENSYIDFAAAVNSVWA